MGNKNAYYFSHDYDPTGDPKMAALIGDYGAIGYGIFWRIVEMLHSDKDHRLPLKKYLYQAIAKQLLDTVKQKLVIDDLPQFVEMLIKDCIETYELFFLDGAMFSSQRVFRHFEKKKTISDLRSENGRKGAIAKQNKNLPFAEKQNEAKEIKGKESIILNNKGGFQCFNAEKFILDNSINFDKICIATMRGSDEVKRELHNYHLWLAKNEKYPTSEGAVLAGIESWILNSKNFKAKYNGQPTEAISNGMPHNLKKLNG